MKSNWQAHLALFLVNAIYGANHIVAKGVMPNYLSPNVFIAIRAIGAVILFWLFKLLFISEKIERRDLGRIAICAFFGVANNQLFFFNGLNLSSSINAGIIMTLNPIMVAILSFFILKERLPGIKWVGILIGATGAILLTLTSGSGQGDSMLGDLFLFINALSYAMYLILVKPLMLKYKPLTVITYVFSIGMIYVLLFPPTMMDFAKTDFSAIPFDAWMKITYVVVGVTFLTYLLTVFALKHLTASVSSVYIYLQPVMVIFFAFMLFYLGWSEDFTGTITLEKMGYMTLIFVGVFLTTTKFKRKIKP